jgi:predicted transcriptional regulator
MGSDVVSKFKIRRYATMVVLSASPEPMTLTDIHRHTGFSERILLRVMDRLIANWDVKINKADKPTTYQITKNGIKKAKWFKEVKHFDQYWKPKWER